MHRDRYCIRACGCDRPGWLPGFTRRDSKLPASCWEGGERGQAALREGLFRRSGELHRWMYDRYSLRRLLETSGFTGLSQRGAFDSAIADFSTFELDGTAGIARKSDSSYLETVQGQGCGRRREGAWNWPV